MSIDFYEKLGRRNYVTPTSYLEMISKYKTLFNDRRLEIQR